MSEPCINNKAKGAEWADSSNLWREIPAKDSCLLCSSSHVFHPPSLSVMTVINDPQLPCASSLTLPSFFLSFCTGIKNTESSKETTDNTFLNSQKDSEEALYWSTIRKAFNTYNIKGLAFLKSQSFVPEF